MAVRDDLIAVGIAGVVVVAALWYAKKKLGEAGQAVADAVAPVIPYVNPADSSNVINQGVSWLGETITGDDGWSLGSQVYDWTHSKPTGNPISLNPASTDNAIYRWNNFIGEKITGEKGWTIGGQIYDWFH